MNPWVAKAVVLGATVVMIAIRAPHGQRSRAVKVVENRKGRLEVALLVLALLGSVVPIVWVVLPLLSFADYALHPVPLALGILCFAVGLWLFHRSHEDLGTNWSITLEVRERHRLIVHGV